MKLFKRLKKKRDKSVSEMFENSDSSVVKPEKSKLSRQVRIIEHKSSRSLLSQSHQTDISRVNNEKKDSKQDLNKNVNKRIEPENDNDSEDDTGFHLNLDDLPNLMSNFLLITKKLGTKAHEGDLRSAVIIISFVSCILVFLGIFSPLLTSFAACAYPVYMSYKAIKTENQEDNSKWLVYWIVYGTTAMLEPLIRPITKLIPYFPTMHLLFLLWLYHDLTNGSMLIYKRYLKPIFDKHSERIDRNIERAEISIKKSLKKF